MRQIVLGSIFRNSESYLSTYFRQITALNEALRAQDDMLRIISVEGDSTDQTFKHLTELSHWPGVDWEVHSLNHGGPDYGRVDDPRRWSQIATVCNKVLDQVRADDDIMVYVESDILYSDTTMVELINALDLYKDYSVMTARVHNAHDNSFWDTWGFRKNGTRFSYWPPYHPDLMPFTPFVSATYFQEIDSCGSLLVMDAEVARSCRFAEEDGIVGFCRDIRAHGYTIRMDVNAIVQHPSNWSAPKP